MATGLLIIVDNGNQLRTMLSHLRYHGVEPEMTQGIYDTKYRDFCKGGIKTHTMLNMPEIEENTFKKIIKNLPPRRLGEIT